MKYLNISKLFMSVKIVGLLYNLTNTLYKKLQREMWNGQSIDKRTLQLNWTSSQTRPDISNQECEISTSVKDVTTKGLKAANKYMHKLKVYGDFQTLIQHKLR